MASDSQGDSVLHRVLDAESETAAAAIIRASEHGGYDSGTIQGPHGEFLFQDAEERLQDDGEGMKLLNSLTAEQLLMVNNLRPQDWLQALNKCQQEGLSWSETLNIVGGNLLNQIRDAEVTQYKTESFTKKDSDLKKSSLWNEVDFVSLAKNTPLRLTYEEREVMKLLESVLEISDYTSVVDSFGGRPRLMVKQLRMVCAILSGLVVARDYEQGQRLLKDRDFKRNEEFFQSAFEIGRRYKLLNPEKMRDSYGKLLYMLMDSSQSHVKNLLEFECVAPVRNVYSFLSSKEDGQRLLKDPIMQIATREIFDEGKSRRQVEQELAEKNEAVKRLIKKYASDDEQPINRRGMFRHLRGLLSLGLDENTAKERLDIVEDKYNRNTLTAEDVETAVYSLSDHMNFLRYNELPCDKMIAYLKAYFHPTDVTDPQFSLNIQTGYAGARLTHGHARQYQYVLQSLVLWKHVLKNFMRLWYLADSDMLSNNYRLQDTGQGLNRVQSCPQVAEEISRIVSEVQHSVGSWMGSSAIHLGDRNVPNALNFIDKYTQVPRILGPLVLCLEKIHGLCLVPSLRQFIDSTYGGELNLKKTILTDFFRHGFDGSGGDNFFDAGSCIDGRLTSTWNWCSKLEKKSYYPIFLLTGFSGFDGKF